MLSKDKPKKNGRVHTFNMGGNPVICTAELIVTELSLFTHKCKIFSLH